MLTNKGKYGLKAMVHLAGLAPGRPALVADIAATNMIPKKFLDAILAVHNRPCHARTITVQAGAEVGDRFKERQVACLEGPGGVYFARIILIIHTCLYAASRL